MNKKIRLYFSGKIQSDLVAHLQKEQSHYLKDVMRLKEGSTFSVFNNQGEWNACVQNYEKKSTKIKILEKLRDKKNEQNIWLAFTPIKQNPLNFIIQKGTELGVQKFIPILSERTVVKDINIERVKKIIIESAEQSNRISVPEINKLEDLIIPILFEAPMPIFSFKITSMLSYLDSKSSFKLMSLEFSIIILLEFFGNESIQS